MWPPSCRGWYERSGAQHVHKAVNRDDVTDIVVGYIGRRLDNVFHRSEGVILRIERQEI